MKEKELRIRVPAEMHKKLKRLAVDQLITMPKVIYFLLDMGIRGYECGEKETK